jgi:nucleoside-diphosphate-sugar epimerase
MPTSPYGLSKLAAEELVGEMMGERMRIRYAPPVPGDVRSTWADLERAARKLGYRPRFPLEEGVEAQVRGGRRAKDAERRLKTRLKAWA